MNSIIKESMCTGCTACFNSCPKHAIRMEKNDDGFVFPIIDQSLCINCGLCKKVCPVINTRKNFSIKECYFSYSKDNRSRMMSSSGGVFSALANCILEKNGIVIGAYLNSENILKHIYISEKKDLNKLRGSKYLQSDLNNIFDFVKKNVQDKYILFVGTPCQVAGLKSFLKKDFDKLFCIDVFCHGVPSTKMFEKYIDELKLSCNNISKFNFRNKVSGWERYSISYSMDDLAVVETSSDNVFMQSYLYDFGLRKSCYNCNFKQNNKYSDISIGDFWGINNYYPDINDDKGVNAIIVNTIKGKKMLLSLNSIILKECKYEEIFDGNRFLEKSPKYNMKKRENFFKEIDDAPLRYLMNKYGTNTFNFSRIILRIKNKLKKILKNKF